MDVPRWRPRPVEVLLALLLAGTGVPEILVPFGSRAGSGSEPASVVGVLVTSVALLWARRAPVVPLVVFTVVWPLVLLTSGSLFMLFYGHLVTMLVILFMTVRYGGRRTPWWGAGVIVGFVVAVDVLVPWMRQPGELVFHWTLLVLVTSAAYGLRTMEHRAYASTRRAIEAEVGAAEQAMQAVVAERTRIARELHDIVAHAVTSMVVQAGAAEQARDDARFVDSALANIRSTGNEALGEMRRLVSMLREADETPLSPQPRIAALPALVELVSAQGTPTRLEVSGEPHDLPASLDLTLYRIVQEALTNVRRHAAASRCLVRLEFGAEQVAVEVVDDGRGGDVDPGTAGHGLVGMRERVGLYGGQLRAGPEPGRGFAVRATLPVAQ